MRVPSRAAVLAVALMSLLTGLLLSAALDLEALPFSGREQLTAISLIDGQAYFGHLQDVPWSDTVVLRDAYYLRDAGGAQAGLSVALTKRGSEPHIPADGMRIRRDKVLLIEPVGRDSAVALAIAAERSIRRLRAAR